MQGGNNMNRLLATKRWLVLVIFAVGGLSLGLADTAFGQLFQERGVKPGLATATTVNGLLPLLTICLGVVHPRLIINWLGTAEPATASRIGLQAILSVRRCEL
jgi:hypothetical protein